MKNILSFAPGTPILGADIRAWFNYHTENNTSHSREAKAMKYRFENLNDDRYYKIILSWESCSCGHIVYHKPLIQKV